MTSNDEGGEILGLLQSQVQEQLKLLNQQQASVQQYHNQLNNKARDLAQLEANLSKQQQKLNKREEQIKKTEANANEALERAKALVEQQVRLHQSRTGEYILHAVHQSQCVSYRKGMLPQRSVKLIRSLRIESGVSGSRNTSYNC